MAKSKKASKSAASVPCVSVAEQRKWEVEDAARTLVRAQEIKTDKELFGRAKTVLSRQQAALDKVLGGR